MSAGNQALQREEADRAPISRRPHQTRAARERLVRSTRECGTVQAYVPSVAGLAASYTGDVLGNSTDGGQNSTTHLSDETAKDTFL